MFHLDEDDFLALLIIHRRKKKRHPRTCNIRHIFARRAELGEMALVLDLESDPEYHHRYFRMNRESFDFLLQKISTKISRQGTHRLPISPVMRLAITLRYIATGNSQISLAMSYRVSPSSVCYILREVLIAVWEDLKDEFLAVPNYNEWEDRAHEFENNWQFPNCCGAIDGKHVRVKSYCHTGSDFYNYKNFFSFVLLAVLDAKYKFVLVDIGAPGSQSDSGILSQSLIGKSLDNGNIKLPSPKKLEGSDVLVPHVLLGDGGFPLKPYMMKPFPRDKSLNKERRVFNYRLSRARRVSENGFGILAARFRIFHKVMECDYDLAVLVTKVSIVLHNYLVTNNDHNNITADREEDGNIVLGNWREMTAGNSGILPIQNFGTNNFTTRAKKVRDDYTKYFSNPKFALPWQDRVTEKGYFN